MALKSSARDTSTPSPGRCLIGPTLARLLFSILLSGSFTAAGCGDDEARLAQRLRARRRLHRSRGPGDPLSPRQLRHHQRHDDLGRGDPAARAAPSFYLDARPAFFGDRALPAIGPDLEPMVSPIPAQERFGSIAQGARGGDGC